MTHPDSQTLQAFILGKLSEIDSLAIEQHLNECEDCNAILSQLSAQDSFTEMLRGLGTKTEKTLPLTRMGNYEIQAELGSGGMGVVYQAFDTRLKRPVALKVIVSGDCSSKQQRERLHLEAQTIASLRHSGIVQIYEIGEYQGHLYLALELLEPENLQTFMTCKQKSFTWSATLIQQLAQIIDYAHQMGVIHRDLKPENILFAKQYTESELKPGDFEDSLLSRVKITDFGLAKYINTDHQISKTKLMLGTPSYMAPEQIPGSDQAITAATDIYALGVILYQLLTGQLPFPQQDLIQALKSLKNEEPPAPRMLNPKIPKDLEVICLKCLMKQPQQRYQSAALLAEDLALFLQGEPIRAKAPSVLQKLICWARRKPMMSSAYLGILIFYSLSQILVSLTHYEILSQKVINWLFAFLLPTFYCLQAMSDSERWHKLSEFLVVIVLSLSMTTAQIFNIANPEINSSYVNIYFFLIVGSALNASSGKLIWFQGGMSMICYLLLMYAISVIRPELALPLPYISQFVFDLLFITLLTYLLLHKISPPKK